MTAKQLLLEYVRKLSEDEAEEAMLWLIPPADRELSQAERAMIDRGLDDVRNGRLTALEDVERDYEDL